MTIEDECRTQADESLCPSQMTGLFVLLTHSTYYSSSGPKLHGNLKSIEDSEEPFDGPQPHGVGNCTLVFTDGI